MVMLQYNNFNFDNISLRVHF